MGKIWIGILHILLASVAGCSGSHSRSHRIEYSGRNMVVPVHFGERNCGEIAEQKIEIVNRSRFLLTNELPTSGCPCLEVTFEPTTIASGESGIAHLSLKVPSTEGPYTIVNLSSVAPDNNLSFRVMGVARTWLYSEVLNGRLVLLTRSQIPFKICDIAKDAEIHFPGSIVPSWIDISIVKNDEQAALMINRIDDDAPGTGESVVLLEFTGVGQANSRVSFSVGLRSSLPIPKRSLKE